ncbi:unnamed protein product [Coffea canephora]|uniref:TPX2 C-terminal domain-containing protein n=1 Tax=Coffea canephora TaxID=49390 RepID=A0A068V774_COFCA|nr:unnamed protein product [Coffea canephora]
MGPLLSGRRGLVGSPSNLDPDTLCRQKKKKEKKDNVACNICICHLSLTDDLCLQLFQKLEEKFNSKELQKVQLQTKLKEKAESELRKLRQSFCFKARPLPEFYKERETQNSQTRKALYLQATSSDSEPQNPNPVTQSQSPKLGRKLSSRTMQGTMPVSLPPPATSLNKNGGISKHVSGKNCRTATRSPASRPEIINHENASPNIPYWRISGRA